VSALIEYCSSRRCKPPDFHVIYDGGPDHQKNFLMKVMVAGREFQPSVGSVTKKLAKATCAAAALLGLGAIKSASELEGGGNAAPTPAKGNAALSLSNFATTVAAVRGRGGRGGRGARGGKGRGGGAPFLCQPIMNSQQQFMKNAPQQNMNHVQNDSSASAGAFDAAQQWPHSAAQDTVELHQPGYCSFEDSGAFTGYNAEAFAPPGIANIANNASFAPPGIANCQSSLEEFLPSAMAPPPPPPPPLPPVPKPPGM